MSLVVDSSAILAWVYGDETTDAICEVFARLTKGEPRFQRCGGWR